MPSWAFGDVDVTGTKAAVTSFSERFIFKEEPRTTPGKRIFGRSFHDESRKHIKSAIDAEFRGKAANEEATVQLSISFAWSADSCMVSRYPTVDPNGCISLPDACKEDQVTVHVHTFLFDEGTEEDINCSPDGKLNRDVFDMVQAKCPHCGELQSISTVLDMEDAYCCECGHQGLEPNTEEE